MRRSPQEAADQERDIGEIRRGDDQWAVYGLVGILIAAVLGEAPFRHDGRGEHSR